MFLHTAPRTARNPTRASRPLLSLAVLTCLCISSWVGSATAEDQEFTLATATETEVPELSLEALKAILSGQTTAWPDGKPITLVLPPRTSPESIWLCSRILGIPDQAYRSILVFRVAQGTGTRLVELEGSAAMREQLLATPGSIGPVATGDLSSNLKAIQTK